MSDGLACYCRSCVAARNKAEYAQSSEKRKVSAARRYRADPSRGIANAKRWQQANPTARAAIADRWRRKNLARLAAKCAKYHTAKMRRIPAWANHEWIRHAYEVAADMTAKTGDAYHVDHEIPLQGKNVSGLHVYENLQILPGVENAGKGNSFSM